MCLLIAYRVVVVILCVVHCDIPFNLCVDSLVGWVCTTDIGRLSPTVLRVQFIFLSPPT